MSIYNEKINYIVSLFGTVSVWLFGSWDLPLLTLISVMALDYITGITRGYINKQLSSDYGFRGLYKKISIFYILILAVLIYRLIGHGFMFRSLVCFWYTANEGTSILPIPQQLVDALVQLKQGNKKYSSEREGN